MSSRSSSGNQNETKTLEPPTDENGASSRDAQADQRAGSPLEKAMWGFYAAYMAYMIFLPTGPGLAPGDPIWGMKPPAWQEVLDLSFNFMLVVTGLNTVGVHVVEAPTVHPVNEGLFNFVIIWSIMLAPLIIGDKRKVSLKTKELLWLGTMFITNVFAIPYMALRSGRPDADLPLQGSDNDDPSWARAFARNILGGKKALGIVGLVIGTFMVYWGFFGRADMGFGGIDERIQYFWGLVKSDRVMFAFVWDVILYSIFQAWLVLDSAKSESERGLAKIGAIPFVGLGLYLLLQPQEEVDG
ncbi:hypothetical protein KFL_000060060 [Klebsormidium nitens]|uniref:Uncharacterized protein n=1 Tax=Klebsormidium nitens TaxID=105231 RepID=A0A0U9HHT5_KLENI|nr:hypothetical protein KFL_000060060 [Klebsormidium nitens]|eukprot:GAQ77941.1 hypothetical protein KFL_000060060 [Klebsormidium nitens]